MTSINREKFFNGVRDRFFGGHISQGQFDGLSRILSEWERRKLTDLRWLAYMLATAYHETGRTMQPVREGGGEDYLRSKKYYPWVGEGLVQVTWEANHRKFGATEPGQLMTWPIALRALFDGMIKGMFTGKKLANYFHGNTADWFNARRIVNGTDKAAMIAGYAQLFYTAAKAAEIAAPAGAVTKTEKTTAGTIVAGGVVASGVNQWLGGTVQTGLIIVGVGFGLLILLAVISATLKKPVVTQPVLQKEGPKPMPNTIPSDDNTLSGGIARLAALGTEWDQVKADIAKARADMRAKASELMTQALDSEKQEADIEAAPPTQSIIQVDAAAGLVDTVDASVQPKTEIAA